MAQPVGKLRPVGAVRPVSNGGGMLMPGVNRGGVQLVDPKDTRKKILVEKTAAADVDIEKGQREEAIAESEVAAATGKAFPQSDPETNALLAAFDNDIPKAQAYLNLKKLAKENNTMKEGVEALVKTIPELWGYLEKIPASDAFMGLAAQPMRGAAITARTLSPGLFPEYETALRRVESMGAAIAKAGGQDRISDKDVAIAIGEYKAALNTGSKRQREFHKNSILNGLRNQTGLNLKNYFEFVKDLPTAPVKGKLNKAQAQEAFINAVSNLDDPRNARVLYKMGVLE